MERQEGAYDESRVYSSKNLRSTVQKDFYNTICHKRKSHEADSEVPWSRGGPVSPLATGHSA
jgi:hypothetical protein